VSREIIRTKNFVADAANFIVDLARTSLGARDEFRIALSGGNTPRPVYAEMARENLPWERVQFTFSDERCVPPDDEQSNYRMARESWFDPAGVPEKSVLRMRGEIDPQIAAQEYEEHLGTNYRHDLILLGMGDDGHTASLFPGTDALDETQRRVVANFVPKFNTWRITFTFPFINSARNVCFLVNAKKNPELIEHVLGGDAQYPSARVKPTEGKLTWILGE
jgi:6-phosphogluconolactonase